MNRRSRNMQLGGIHHVTAVTGNASRNVAFYTQVLGMRLTKKTVNQDDVSAYHLFYGDELGRPGTDLTFFDWPDVGYHRPGVGTISTISLGVTGRDALNWWVKRFNDFHVAHDGIRTRGADDLLVLPCRSAHASQSRSFGSFSDRGAWLPAQSYLSDATTDLCDRL